MSFRTRLLLAFAIAALVPLITLGVGVRRQIDDRLTAQYDRRVEALARVVGQDLARESVSIASRLAALSSALAADNRFRLAAVQRSPAERPYLLDYAEGAMRLAGLDLLQLQDEQGRILSSGHFRNEYDRLDPDLPHEVEAAPGAMALVRARGPAGPFLALVRADSLLLGGRRFTLLGGVAVDERLIDRFGRDGELTLSLVTPDTVIAAGVAAAAVDTGATDSTPAADGAGQVASQLPLAYIDAWAPDSLPAAPARLIVSHSRVELAALQHDVARWFLIALAAATALALLLGLWLSSWLSRPLSELARATSSIDLDRLDVELAAGRSDEIGILARRLGAMMRRLRVSAGKLRAAERRATVGEMARQVNHDIKNGLIPIRNVLRHLVEVQESRPAELAAVFGERRPTLESSITYLDTLARSYARLTPRAEPRPLDPNTLLAEIARSAGDGSAVELRLRLADSLPRVVADPVILRRIVENLVANAVESLDGGAGIVTLSTRGQDGAVRLMVEDSGRGMTEEELAHAFDDFFTTKPRGTGLGLSVVRRLVADLHGSLRVESEPGRGTRFTIDLPAEAGAP